LRLPYVGSGVLASALASSKPHAKVQLRNAGLPVAPDALIQRGDDLRVRWRELRSSLGASLVFKPASGGSAIGVEIVSAEAGEDEALAAIERAFAVEPCLLVEPFVRGDEATCGVLETAEGAGALPPTKISPRASGHYDFISKYKAGGSVHQCPAPFPSELSARIQAAALAAHRALGCRDLSRTDFLVQPEQGTFVLLEVNTLPGMTPTSLFPEAAAAVNIAFPALCDGLVRRAKARPLRAAPAAPSMPT
jgi:D-alanine-D-alanine ligase